jgi:two-component system OmpR family sensor kinase
MRTIRQQLLIWLLGGTFICSAIAGSALYWKVRREANELFDAQLEQASNSMPAVGSGCSDQGVDGGPEEKVIVQAWDQNGLMIDSCTSEPRLPRIAGGGYHTVKVGAEQWRVYGKHLPAMYIETAQPMSVREALAEKIAMRSLSPFLILIPVLAIFIWIVVGRSLRPIARLAEAVGNRSATALQPLSAEGLPPEIRPVLDALNDLLRQLDHALATQRAFVADAAHELRTPLTALKLQLQLAQCASNDEQRVVAFDKLHERLDRASRLVHQLLTLARHETNIEVNQFDAVDLQLLAQEIVSDFYVLAERKNIDLGVNTNPTPQIVRGNIDGLRVLLSNLVDNALRYTPVGGRIDISMPTIDGHPALQVSDDGPGISESDQLRVFDRFYRGEVGQTMGSGLGLAIVRNIADIHGATIQLSKTSPESGLTVQLVFQLKDAATGLLK